MKFIMFDRQQHLAVVGMVVGKVAVVVVDTQPEAVAGILVGEGRSHKQR